jgi:hypothetical protein
MVILKYFKVEEDEDDDIYSKYSTDKDTGAKSSTEFKVATTNDRAKLINI